MSALAHAIALNSTRFVDLDNAASEVESSILEICADAGPLGAEVRHALGVAGKRLRSRLALGWYLLSSGQSLLDETAIQAAAAVELLHEATLAHDDICDVSLVRRGQPSVAARFGVRRAGLCGAWLAGKAIRTLAALCAGLGVAFDGETLRQLAEGQSEEGLESSDDALSAIQHYFEVIRGKTGALFSLACTVGSRLGGASAGRPVDLGAPRVYADALATAFQVLDDVLDLESDPRLRRPGCGDLARGVATWPALDWIRRSEDPGAAWAELRRPDKTPDEVLALQARICGSGANDRARLMIREELWRARRTLLPFEPSCAAAALASLLDDLARR